ncbi:hypothetical protein KIPB_006687 [Kipferlia bialata]|uniref:Transmembrane protein n=1 Tax=Kipferlia bialata TaxID=797122 RepID=A0A9K3CZK3_9EUKA|nr:hypothetical protein KIPB_006687 [Kipferlia bialata]|eukprot:g6687.t1
MACAGCRDLLPCPCGACRDAPDDGDDALTISAASVSAPVHPAQTPTRKEREAAERAERSWTNRLWLHMSVLLVCGLVIAGGVLAVVRGREYAAVSSGVLPGVLDVDSFEGAELQQKGVRFRCLVTLTHTRGTYWLMSDPLGRHNMDRDQAQAFCDDYLVEVLGGSAGVERESATKEDPPSDAADTHTVAVFASGMCQAAPEEGEENTVSVPCAFEVEQVEYCRVRGNVYSYVGFGALGVAVIGVYVSLKLVRSARKEVLSMREAAQHRASVPRHTHIFSDLDKNWATHTDEGERERERDGVGHRNSDSVRVVNTKGPLSKDHRRSLPMAKRMHPLGSLTHLSGGHVDTRMGPRDGSLSARDDSGDVAEGGQGPIAYDPMAPSKASSLPRGYRNRRANSASKCTYTIHVDSSISLSLHESDRERERERSVSRDVSSLSARGARGYRDSDTASGSGWDGERQRESGAERRRRSHSSQIPSSPSLSMSDNPYPTIPPPSLAQCGVTSSSPVLPSQIPTPTPLHSIPDSPSFPSDSDTESEAETARERENEDARTSYLYERSASDSDAQGSDGSGLHLVLSDVTKQ